MGELDIRHAQADDAASIRALVQTSGINPTGLDWRRFLVAVEPLGGVIACGQVKQHGGGVLELASIAVKQPYRGRGAARAIIERLLLANPRPLLLMCRSSLGSMYEQFGFRSLAYDAMPRYFQRVSKLAGVAEALARSSEQLLVMKLE